MILVRSVATRRNGALPPPTALLSTCRHIFRRPACLRQGMTAEEDTCHQMWKRLDKWLLGASYLIISTSASCTTSAPLSISARQPCRAAQVHLDRTGKQGMKIPLFGGIYTVLVREVSDSLLRFHRPCAGITSRDRTDEARLALQGPGLSPIPTSCRTGGRVSCSSSAVAGH